MCDFEVMLPEVSGLAMDGRGLAAVHELEPKARLGIEPYTLWVVTSAKSSWIHPMPACRCAHAGMPSLIASGGRSPSSHTDTVGQTPVQSWSGPAARARSRSTRERVRQHTTQLPPKRPDITTRRLSSGSRAPRISASATGCPPAPRRAPTHQSRPPPANTASGPEPGTAAPLRGCSPHNPHNVRQPMP